MNSQTAPGYNCQLPNEKQKKPKKTRLLKIVILVLLIIISTLICALWVLFVRNAENPEVAGYSEFCCSSDNQTCLTLLCPAGKHRERYRIQRRLLDSLPPLMSKTFSYDSLKM